MSARVIRLNLVTGEFELVTVPVSGEVSSTPAAEAIPRANSEGLIDPDWIGGPLSLAIIPVAEDGEVSEAKLVRADDSRLGNPPVGGDLSGTAAAATVTHVRGRAVASTPPGDGQALVWDAVANSWGPGDVGGGAGNATQIQGRAVAGDAPSVGDALVWDGNAWTPAPAGVGGGDGIGGVLYLFHMFR